MEELQYKINALKEKIEMLKKLAYTFRNDFDVSQMYSKDIKRFEKMLLTTMEELKISTSLNQFNIGF